MASLCEPASNVVDKFVNYLQKRPTGTPLKTVEFVNKATQFLGVSKNQAMNLSLEFDFEDGMIFDVACLFDMTKDDKPMRHLYREAINDAVEKSTVGSQHEEMTVEKYDAVKDIVDGVVADMRKLCHDGYTLDSSVFIDVAIRHDLRRSEAWRLLEPMGFEEGLCVSVSTKWFDANGKMRELYWETLADAYAESAVSGHVHSMGTGEVVDVSSSRLQQSRSWARPTCRPGLLQSSFETVRGNKANPTNPTTPKKKSGGESVLSKAPTPSSSQSFRHIDVDSKRATSMDGDEIDELYDDTSDGDEMKNSEKESPRSSFSSPRSETPDWGSSYKWKKRVKNVYGSGGGM